MGAFEELDSYLKSKKNMETRKAAPIAPIYPMQPPPSPFNVNKDQTTSKESSGLILPVPSIRQMVDVVSQTAGNPAKEKYDENVYAKDGKTLLHGKGDVVTDENGNPKLIPQLSGFKYLTEDIMNLKNLRDQLIKHRQPVNDLTGTMRGIKAIAGEKDLGGYKPPTDQVGDLAAQLQKHGLGIMKGNEAFTEDQIAMLGKLITPPQKVLQVLTDRESGNKTLGSGGLRDAPQHVFKAKQDLMNASSTLDQIDNLIGATNGEIKDLPGYGRFDAGKTAAANFFGIDTQGSKMQSLLQAAAALTRHELFGATFTPGEKQAAATFIADPSNQPAAKLFLKGLYRAYPLMKRNFMSTYGKYGVGLEGIR